MNDIINLIIILISILIIAKLIYEYFSLEIQIKKNKMSKRDFYKLVTINLLPFFIYEMYKEQSFYNSSQPLHCKLGEILVILFCYILYLEIVYPLVI